MAEYLNIPGYRIKRELGSGGMATVYEAIQESLERTVALKIMAPSLSANRDFSKRFLSEGRTVAQFTHPNIVAIYDIGEHANRHYMAMEFVGGGDLKSKIGKGIPAKSALEIVLQIARALEYAHQKGYIHRDIKPDNILFSVEGHVAKLTDFGIARAIDDSSHLTATGMSIGTPYYMSPEQCQGQHDLDARSDIYSLGIVLVEMLTGKLPYDAANTVGIVMKHVTEPVPALPPQMQQLQPLLDRMLAKDRGQRFESASALITALESNDFGSLKPKRPRSRGASATQISQASSGIHAAAAMPGKRTVSPLIWIAGGALLAVALTLGIKFWPAIEATPPGGGAAAPALPSSNQGRPEPIVTKPRSSGPSTDRSAPPAGLTSQEPEVVAPKQPPPVQQYALNVTTIPPDAQVKILNIEPKYQPGMMLDPGMYHVEASRTGYEPVREWLEITDSDVARTFTLEAVVEQTPRLKQGQDCPVCPEMVTIRGGSFEMGDPSGPMNSDARPLHRVRIDSFAISKTEVTFDEWDACVQEGGCNHRPKDRGWGRGTRPVIFVNWNDARQYTDWLSRKTGNRYRLPSEAEWEYAARAGKTTAYSWGNQLGSGLANCDGCGSTFDNNNTAPVGTFKPNGFGLLDMHGNVWEWTQDCWNTSYAGAPANGSAWESGECALRVLRGGSWYFTPTHMQVFNRYRLNLNYRTDDNGFRVAKDLKR